jgi:hypothetical protein
MGRVVMSKRIMWLSVSALVGAALALSGFVAV